MLKDSLVVAVGIATDIITYVNQPPSPTNFNLVYS